jgi:hypothetical protein
LRAAPCQDRGIGFTKPRVVTDVRGHRRDATRGFERRHQTGGFEWGRDSDTEIDRQLICIAGAIDKDVLSVEMNRARTGGRVHLIQVASELLRDATAPDLRPNARYLSRGGGYFLDFVWHSRSWASF